MFILKDENQLQNAIKRAKQIRPKVKVLMFGKYLVTGPKGNLYKVVCRKDEQTNQRVVCCSCKAAERNLPCFHSAVAVTQHIYLAGNRQIEKA